MQLEFYRSALLWFNSYLHNRCQCVSYCGSQSNFLIVEKGVPQGSSLGPLLFSFFFNDLPLASSGCHYHLYADDVVIYTFNTNILEMQTLLQTEFTDVQNWLNFNKLQFNKKKSCVMLFGTRHNLSHLPSDLSVCFNDGTPLAKVDTIKYLGLWIDSALTFKPHIKSIINKINRNLSILHL